MRGIGCQRQCCRLQHGHAGCWRCSRSAKVCVAPVTGSECITPLRKPVDYPRGNSIRDRSVADVVSILVEDGCACGQIGRNRSRKGDWLAGSSNAIQGIGCDSHGGRGLLHGNVAGCGGAGGEACVARIAGGVGIRANRRRGDCEGGYAVADRSRSKDGAILIEGHRFAVRGVSALHVVGIEKHLHGDLGTVSEGDGRGSRHRQGRGQLLHSHSGRRG